MEQHIQAIQADLERIWQCVSCCSDVIESQFGSYKRQGNKAGVHSGAAARAKNKHTKLYHCPINIDLLFRIILNYTKYIELYSNSFKNI